MKKEVFSDQFKLERIGADDFKEIKNIYIWQIEEYEKDKYSCLPVSNQIIQFTESGLDSFTQAFRNVLKSRAYYILKYKDGTCQVILDTFVV